VAWITERKNVLSGVFYLGAALAYLHYALAPENKSDRDKSRMFYIVSLVLFACALLSKTTTCLLPAVLLLVLWWKRERIGWTDIRGLILFFVLGIAFGLLTAGVEKQHVGAIGKEWDLSFIERCLVAGRALCFYAGKLFWPTRLTFIYPRWNIDTGVWWQYLYPAIAVSVVAVFWLARRRIGKGPVAAVLIFAGTLMPALGFLNFYMMRYTFAADHFQYLASLSLITLVTCHRAAVPSKRWKICVATVVIAFVLGSLGVLTWRQCHIYKNSETLWRDTLRKNPNSWMAHACLGNALRAQERYDEAISCYFQALQLKPDNADSYYNLGTVSDSQGKLDEAIDYYRQALQAQPDYTPAYYNLGDALASKGHLDESIEQYRLALKFKPDYVEAHNSLGWVLSEQGKIDEAINHFRQALRLRPDFASAHRNLGNAFSMQGRLDEAVQHYRRSLQTEPHNAAAHYNLGIVLCLQGKLDEAIGHYQQAMKFDPDLVGAYNNLALILATHPDPNIRNVDKAVSLAEQAAELTSRQDVVILDTLATVYSKAGRYEQALITAQAALELASAAADNEMAEHLRKQVELYRQQKLMQKDQTDLAMPLTSKTNRYLRTGIFLSVFAVCILK
jgi:tetratricopeptide (TPR) repeat protein